MKPYTVQIEIDLSRERVVALFDDPANLAKWQTGLRSVERLEGVAGQVGAKSRLVFQNGKHRIELLETVTERDLPDRVCGTYAWKGGQNTLVNRFVALGPQRTRWESDCAYTFRSPFLKALGLLAPGMFRKQNLRFLEDFKAFCEEGRDVRERP